MHQHLTPHAVVHDLVLTVFNVSAWMGAILTWANVSALATILGTATASAVSIATFLWIRKQSRAFDREQTARDDERREAAAERMRDSLYRTGHPPVHGKFVIPPLPGD